MSNSEDEDFISIEELMQGLAEALTPEQREGAYALASLLAVLPGASDGSWAFRVRLADVWEICLTRFSHYVCPLIPDHGDNAIEIVDGVVHQHQQEQPTLKRVH